VNALADCFSVGVVWSAKLAVLLVAFSCLGTETHTVWESGGSAALLGVPLQIV
jgi:hypothetical protein